MAYDGARPEEIAFLTPSIIVGPNLLELTKRLSWFRFEARTHAILSAFSAFESKIKARITDKKDLPVICNALRDLAAYFYTEIPEIHLGTEEESLHLRESGDGYLLSFAKMIESLDVYHPESKTPSARESASVSLSVISAKLARPFSHENVLYCFLAWYFLSLLLIASGFLLAFHYLPGLKLDTVIVSTVVGGPVAGAITAVTIAKLRRSDQSGDRAPQTALKDDLEQ
jgi:hypothetical protein